jgi:hypothetical protein
MQAVRVSWISTPDLHREDPVPPGWESGRRLICEVSRRFAGVEGGAVPVGLALGYTSGSTKSVLMFPILHHNILTQITQPEKHSHAARTESNAPTLFCTIAGLGSRLQL